MVYSLIYVVVLFILAIIHIFQHKCDLINMSYGEPTLLPDYGRFIDLVNEVPILNMMIEADTILISPGFLI